MEQIARQVAVGRSPETALHDHVKPLDGLRGIAVLLVIIPHLANNGMVPDIPGLQRLAGTVAHGVDLFFVLSGFGLAFPFLALGLAGKRVNFDVLTYAFNRVYRVLPLFYLTIALTYVVVAIARSIGTFKNDTILWVPHSLYQAIAPLLLLDFRNLPINPGLWTIAVQFRWYAVFPLLLIVWMKSPRAFAVLLGWAWIGYLFTRERNVDLGTLPLFMLGIVAADLIARRHRIVRFAPLLVLVATAIAIAWDPHATIPDAWGYDGHFIGQPTSFAWQAAVFGVVLCAATMPGLRSVFAWRPLVALGTASFSVYLVHQPVLALVFARFGTGPLSGAIALLGSLAVGFGFWWCFERQLTNSQRRRMLRDRALPALRRVFGWLGLPNAFVVVPARAEESTASRTS